MAEHFFTSENFNFWQLLMNAIEVQLLYIAELLYFVPLRMNIITIDCYFPPNVSITYKLAFKPNRSFKVIFREMFKKLK